MNGCLGDGTTAPRSAPVRVPLPERAVRLAASYSSTCVLLHGGCVWCWGWTGQTHSLSPILVFGNSNGISAGYVPISIAAGKSHFCVVVRHTRKACEPGGNGMCQTSAHEADLDAGEAESVGRMDETVWCDTMHVTLIEWLLFSSHAGAGVQIKMGSSDLEAQIKATSSRII